MKLNDSEELRILKEIEEVTLENKLYTSIMINPITPRKLRMLGLKNLPIIMSAKHVRNCLRKGKNNPHWHGLHKTDLVALYKELRDPTIVMDSFNEPNSIVIVMNRVNKSKIPIIGILRTNGKGQYQLKSLLTNYLTSVYAKDNFMNMLKKALNQNLVLFTHKEKIQSLEQFSQLQLLQAFPKNFEFNKIIHQSQTTVKNNYNSKKTSILSKINEYKAEAAKEDAAKARDKPLKKQIRNNEPEH